MTRLFIFFLMFSSTVLGVDFSSGTIKTTVVELYTSEGCSSCPPADRWLSRWTSDPNLFKSVIPLAFHVDYWDQLGWTDRLAQAAFSERQRDLAANAMLSQVYTPAFVVNSKEWRGWFRGQSLPDSTEERSGVLAAQLHEQHLSVQYSENRRYVLNVAYLGMGLTTDVQAGENRSRRLAHDFVVLQHQQYAAASMWEENLPEIPDKGQQRTAICVWLTAEDSLKIVQAAAAFID